VARARRGEGPTLLEAKTYRFEEHCNGLTFERPYRMQAEIDSYRNERDPVVTCRANMLGRGIPEADIEALEREVAAAVIEAVSFARESPLPDLRDVYLYMYSNPIHYPPTNPDARLERHD